jgi:D-amino-acid dehydrogenase
MFSKESPLTIKPTAGRPIPLAGRIPALLQCPARRQTTIDLLQLAFYSRDQLTQWNAGLHLSFDHQRSGKLVMFTDAQAWSRRAAGAIPGAIRLPAGSAGRCRMHPHRTRAGPLAARLGGGVYTPSEEAGDCPQFCRALVDVMQAHPNFRFIGGARDADDVRREAGACAPSRPVANGLRPIASCWRWARRA